MDAVAACSGLSAEHRGQIERWAQKGLWTGDSLQTIGAMRLRKARPFHDMGELCSREDFVLWHAWGSPTPHSIHPQWILFEVVDAVCFRSALDQRPFVSHLRTAEQRTAWAVHLSAHAIESLKNALCLDNRSFERCMLDWGLQPTQGEYVVFTSLPPIVYLVGNQRWRTLADIPRCTPQLLRRPRGAGLEQLKHVVSVLASPLRPA